ncbi:MAG: hypothetical protein RLZZ444_1920 [Pseudomonadota bacterium]
MAALSIAFEAPDNYRGNAFNHSPIDLVHLARQTSGDQRLELEVLHTFARQARICMQELSLGQREQVVAIAHRLRGAAQAVGAFKVSDAAEQLEAANDDAASMARLGQAVVEAENYILKLSR